MRLFEWPSVTQQIECWLKNNRCVIESLRLRKIRLERHEWEFDESQPLGPAGGFGEVFLGAGDGKPVAIKRLKLSAGAASHREMAIGSALADRQHDHVVPVLDFGRDAEGDRYYLVMPVCDRSLQDELDTEVALTGLTAKSVALEIAAGLTEVGDIVHRDLKPGNVLFYQGRWRIADFGIAKFVEDATSLESLRTSLTPAYAAPEQWRGERPTKATDVYALGCILYALLTGKPPFSGSLDDIREAHLHQMPLPLVGVDARLSGLIAMMLRKSAGSRPSLDRCSAVLSQIDDTPRPAARSALAVAGSMISQEEAAAEAAKQARETAARERKAIANEAVDEIHQIVIRLFNAIAAEASTARREPSAVVLGPAILSFNQPVVASGALVAAVPSGPRPWDIISTTTLILRCQHGKSSHYDSEYYLYSVTLYFGTSGNDLEYRWREISFCDVIGNRSFHEQPFAISGFDPAFAMSVSNTLSQSQIAFGPAAIDGENEADFENRWMTLFARAAERKLRAPSQMPPPKTFFE